MNKVMLIGNVGNQPEIKMLTGGSEVANFSMATTEYWSDDNGTQSRTTWHHVQTFKPYLLKVIKNYVKKGSKIAIDGSYQSRDWETKEGEKRRAYFVSIDSLELLDSKPSNQPE